MVEGIEFFSESVEGFIHIHIPGIKTICNLFIFINGKPQRNCLVFLVYIVVFYLFAGKLFTIQPDDHLPGTKPELKACPRGFKIQEVFIETDLGTGFELKIKNLVHSDFLFTRKHLKSESRVTDVSHFYQGFFSPEGFDFKGKYILLKVISQHPA